MNITDFQDLLLEHFRTPYHQGHFSEATVSQTAFHPLCGDQITVQLQVDHASQQIRSAWFTGQGCLLSQAAASLLCQWIEGRQISDLDEQRLQEFLHPLISTLSPRRKICALLGMQAFREAVRKYSESCAVPRQ